MCTDGEATLQLTAVRTCVASNALVARLSCINTCVKRCPKRSCEKCKALDDRSARKTALRSSSLRSQLENALCC